MSTVKGGIGDVRTVAFQLGVRNKALEDCLMGAKSTILVLQERIAKLEKEKAELQLFIDQLGNSATQVYQPKEKE